MFKPNSPNEFLIIAAFLSAAAGFVLLGCEEKSSWEDPSPEATFEAFLMDWYRGEYEDAFAAIAPEDRKRLTEPLEELDGRLDDENMPDEVDMLVVGRVDNPYDIDDIELEQELDSPPESGQEVELELIYHDGRKGKAQLVWGGERWFVDLPAKIRDEPTDGQPIDRAAHQTPEQDAGAGNTDSGDGSGEDAPSDADPANHDEK